MNRSKKVFAYVRVSTVRQGEHGVSLQEQRDAIERYAARQGFRIADWFSETETAAKRGRPIFARMMKLLHKRQAEGVLIHKIDRSARNFKDWADIADLIDRGIEVHFCHESIDLNTRGGRLTADIQAVIAADYIRNLKEETRKGVYGRLKQGLYPLPAPLGYLDRGPGRPKEPDLATAPLIRQAFDLYATGEWPLRRLRKEMSCRGLRNRGGSEVSLNGLSVILNNPFYAGVIRLRSTKETFPGIHQPIVPMAVFEQAQSILRGKHAPRHRKHAFLFRRLVTCKSCGRSLVGEIQKGHVYYRCHAPNCPRTCVTQEAIERALREQLERIRLSDAEVERLEGMLGALRENWETERVRAAQALELQLGQLHDRLNRLTDAYVDRLIDKDAFQARREALLVEQGVLRDRKAALAAGAAPLADRIAGILEQAKNACLSYDSAVADDKRELVKTVSSNRWVDGKTIGIELQMPFRELANRQKIANGCPSRGDIRTGGGRDGLVPAPSERSDAMSAVFLRIVAHVSAGAKEGHAAQ